MSLSHQSESRPYLLSLLLLFLFACTPSTGDLSATDQTSEPASTSLDGAAQEFRCVTLAPKEDSEADELSNFDQWVVKAYEIYSDARVSALQAAETKSDFRGLAEICLLNKFFKSPLLFVATNQALGTELKRIVFPDIATAAPSVPGMMGPPSGAPAPQTAPLAMDLLTTRISEHLLSVLELPFMAPASLPNAAVDSIYAATLLNSDVRDGLEERSLTLTTVREAWNDHISKIQVGRGQACPTADFPEGVLSASGVYTFPGAVAQTFFNSGSGLLAATLDTDGSLASLATVALDSMTVTVNGVNLMSAGFDSFHGVGNDHSGALMEIADFDSAGDLDAEFSMIHLHNGWNDEVLIPCVAGLLTIDNQDGDDPDNINAGSKICIDAVTGGNLFQQPDNGALGDDPDSDTSFIVFGDDASGNAWILGAPGIRSGANKDIIRISVADPQVCVETGKSHQLEESGEEGDRASLYYYLCVVKGGVETFSSAQVNGAGRPGFNVGSHPAQFSASSLDEKTIAQEIGYADFFQNPKAIDFIDAETRATLLNLWNGKTANVAFAGYGTNADYRAFLNGGGDALAEIHTGPQGQWTGSIHHNDLKAGDFIRFKASGDVEGGSYFDVPVGPACREF